jgi:hypothetical protein
MDSVVESATFMPKSMEIPRAAKKKGSWGTMIPEGRHTDACLLVHENLLASKNKKSNNRKEHKTSKSSRSSNRKESHSLIYCSAVQ